MVANRFSFTNGVADDSDNYNFSSLLRNSRLISLRQCFPGNQSHTNITNAGTKLDQAKLVGATVSLRPCDYSTNGLT